MTNIKEIAALMCESTFILHEETHDLHNGEKINLRVGTGKRTCYFHRKREITYGLLMIENKLIRKNAFYWTTGKEIIDRNYFNGEFTYKNLIIATVLHEYAHFIQSLQYKRVRNSVHNSDFYNILDSFYDNNYHILIGDYFNKSKTFKNAEFTDLSDVFTKEEVQEFSYINVNIKGKNEVLKVIKANPKKVVCVLYPKTNYTYTVPYRLVLGEAEEEKIKDFYNYENYEFDNKQKSFTNKNHLLGAEYVDLNYNGHKKCILLRLEDNIVFAYSNKLKHSISFPYTAISKAY